MSLFFAGVFITVGIFFIGTAISSLMFAGGELPCAIFGAAAVFLLLTGGYLLWGNT